MIMLTTYESVHKDTVARAPNLRNFRSFYIDFSRCTSRMKRDAFYLVAQWKTPYQTIGNNR